MKIAIPTFGTRVSPRFDCADTYLIVDVAEGRESRRAPLAASGWGAHQRVHKLIELGVETVLCGGIDCCSVACLQAAGVTVYGWVAGELEDALAALLRGDLDSQAALERGGRWRCRRFAGDGPGQGVGSDFASGGGGRRGRGRRAGGPGGGRRPPNG